ncbi:MAG: ABC transporter substrate-binding protein [Eubacteriales bacterium]|jgi:iron complex transport system substrate-binding protein|nr:ABC transporter substrate-binding protein [Eubacteriales bacterium]
MKQTGRRILLGLVLVLVLAFVLTSCAPNTPAETTPGETTGETKGETPAPTEGETEDDTFVFVDSLGREVTLPKELTKIAPSGTLANILLFTAIPDHLSGIAQNFTDTQMKLIDPKYNELPVLGKFYGKGPDYNLETVLAAGTQVIVDLGEAKDSTATDMDELTAQINIPTVFIEALFDDMPQTYRDLGVLIGDSSKTEQLALYCEESLALSEKAKLSDNRVSVYWAMGDLGLNTNARGSFHSELLDYVPLINAADIEADNRGGGSEVSMEQIIQWDPDYILIDTLQLKEEMLKDPAWNALPAIKEGRYLVVPQVPYGFLADPPSVNRYIGLRWLGATFYPEIYTGDIKDEVKTFFELFYGIKTDDATIDEILAGTYK